MFYYLNGTVAEIAAGLAVIDCGGVGYACATTNYTLSQLKKGERARLYTYLHVREDIFELYGFASQQELNSFKMLIGVSGVGPKAALAILSATTPQNLALSIVTEDEKALTAAQGIGKKIAQLKDGSAAAERDGFNAVYHGARLYGDAALLGHILMKLTVKGLVRDTVDRHDAAVGADDEPLGLHDRKLLAKC